jgi:hypothetical protein
MHATTEQLLCLRDGETVAPAVHDHVEDCDDCRRELVRLARVRDQLRSLAPIEPAGALWKNVASEAVAPAPGPRFSWLSAAAIAASLVLALALVTRLGGDGESAPPAAPATAMDHTPAPATTVVEVPPADDAATLAELQLRSRRLEGLRRAMPERPQIVRASTARTIADLQDQIALVDLRLNAAADLELTQAQREALWRERVYLMQSLIQLEYARLQSPRY